MSTLRVTLQTAQGPVLAAAPAVVSASRATDIPAFHVRWFMQRLRAGHAMRRNPINRKPGWISFKRLGALVFWTKNPAPLLPHLEEIATCCPDFYFLFSLNDYQHEGWEPALPPLAQRLETFRQLAERIGPDRVVWRFDPVCVADPGPDMETMIRRMQDVGQALRHATRRMIFSFVQIREYAKVRASLKRSGCSMREPNGTERIHFCEAAAAMGQKYGMTIMHCAAPRQETVPGILPGKCVDDALLAQICSPENQNLREYLHMQPALPGLDLGVPATWTPPPRDPSQRKACNCTASRDIGEYNTCAHGCVYCYATTSPHTAQKNIHRLKETMDDGETPPNLIP